MGGRGYLPAVKRWAVVARREFLERVRTRWFVIITVLGPVVMAGLIVVPAWLGARSAMETVRVQVLDQSGQGLFPGIVRAAAAADSNLHFESVATGLDQSVLLGRIRDKKINGYLLLPKGVLDGTRAVYRGDNATNLRLRMVLVQALNQAAVEVRAKVAGVPMATIQSLATPKVEVDLRHDTGTGEDSSAEATFLIGYVVMFILYMSILLYAINVMRSVVQEKTSRVIEILDLRGQAARADDGQGHRGGQRGHPAAGHLVGGRAGADDQPGPAPRRPGHSRQQRVAAADRRR